MEIFGTESIVGAIKAVRLRRARHVSRMSDDKVVKRIFNGKFDGTRGRGKDG